MFILYDWLVYHITSWSIVNIVFHLLSFFCKQTYRKFKQVLNFQCIYMYTCIHACLPKNYPFMFNIQSIMFHCVIVDLFSLQLYQLLFIIYMNKHCQKAVEDEIWLHFFLFRKIANTLNNSWLLVSYYWNCRVKLFYKRIIPVRFVLE